MMGKETENINYYTETLEALTLNMELSRVKVLLDCCSCPREMTVGDRCITIYGNGSRTRLCSECCEKIMSWTFQNKVSPPQ